MLNIPAGFSQWTITTRPIDTGKSGSFSFGCASGDLDATLTAINAWIDDVTSGLLFRLYAQYYVSQVTGLTATERIVDGTIRYGEGSAVALSPPQVAPLLKKVTNARGRGKQGRMTPYGVLAEADVDNHGVLDPAAQSGLDSTFSDLWVALGTADANMVILHPVGVADAPTVVNDIICEPLTVGRNKRVR